MSQGLTISKYERYKKVRKAKKPNTGVLGESPPRIVKEFDVELAKPQVLFNKNILSGICPEQWKTEYTTPIEKVAIPES